MWGLESRSRTSKSRSRLLWQSLGLGLVSKFEPGLGLGGYGLDYITGTCSSIEMLKECMVRERLGILVLRNDIRNKFFWFWRVFIFWLDESMFPGEA